MRRCGLTAGPAAAASAEDQRMVKHAKRVEIERAVAANLPTLNEAGMTFPSVYGL